MAVDEHASGKGEELFGTQPASGAGRASHESHASHPPYIMHARTPSAPEPPDRPIATVILPAYNEAAALPTVLMGLLAVLDHGCEIIVVDDASTDATARIAREYPCRLLRHERNRGKGAAVRTGLGAARGRFVVVMDADCTYPAIAVPEMIALSGRYEFVRCVRLAGASHIPPLNRLGNRLFDHVLRALHGLDGVDHLSGLYGLRREAFDALGLTAEGFDLEVEIGIKAHALGLRTISLPIHYDERRGAKKLRAWRDGWTILCRAVALAFYARPA